MKNPFVGSKVIVTSFFKENEVVGKDFGEIDDENERYIIYKNGVLVRKTYSSVNYFNNK